MVKIPFITRYTYVEPEYKSIPGEHVTDDSQYVSDAELITGLLTGTRVAPPPTKMIYGLEYDEKQKKYVGFEDTIPLYGKQVGDVPGDGEIAHLQGLVIEKKKKLDELQTQIEELKKSKAKKSKIEELQAQIDQLKSDTPPKAEPPTPKSEKTDSE